MALTALQIKQLNNMNEAAQKSGLGTLLAALEGGTAGNLRSFSQTVARAAFTDGGAALGTFLITAGTIPVGATFLYSEVNAVTGFIGDTSAVLTIGNAAGDVDRYNTGTPSVFTTAAAGISVGAPSGIVFHTVAGSITLFITSAADFTNVSAGSITVTFYYLV